MTLGQRNFLLLALAVLLAGIPTLMAMGLIPALVADPQWAGGDGLISDTAEELGATPWFNPLFSPADLGIEPIMFGLQGLLGGLLAAAFLGWLVGRRHAQTGVEGTERRTATIVAIVGLVTFALLMVVQLTYEPLWSLGELQAFFAALQGLGLGTLAFFLGYPMGRRAAPARTSAA